MKIPPVLRLCPIRCAAMRRDTVGKIKAEGITPVLLTGDHEQAARYMAKRLGISEVHANWSAGT